MRPVLLTMNILPWPADVFLADVLLVVVKLQISVYGSSSSMRQRLPSICFLRTWGWADALRGAKKPADVG